MSLLWVVLIYISRLYVGVHFPLDVIGAAVITIITSSLLLQKKRIFEPMAKLVFKMYALAAKRILFLEK